MLPRNSALLESISHQNAGCRIGSFIPAARDDFRLLARGVPMREWNLVVAPVVVVIYFIVFPAQFNALISWAEYYVR
jgi:hypothetical protein